MATCLALISGPSVDDASRPLPSVNSLIRLTSFSVNSSRTALATWKRLAAVHASPPLRILARIAPSTAASTSASSNTTNGALPPSSIDVPQQLVGACFTSALPTPGRPGERQLAQPAVVDQRGGDVAGIGGRQHRQHALGQAGLVHQLGQQQHRQRRLLGGLDDHRAARGHRRPDLAGAHRQREVPRRDRVARADGLLGDDDAAGARGARRVAAVDAHGLLGEPAEELGAVRDLAHALGQHLAHLQRHQRGDVLGAVGDRLEHRRAGSRRARGAGWRPTRPARRRPRRARRSRRRRWRWRRRPAPGRRTGRARRTSTSPAFLTADPQAGGNGLTAAWRYPYSILTPLVNSPH